MRAFPQEEYNIYFSNYLSKIILAPISQEIIESECAAMIVTEACICPNLALWTVDLKKKGHYRILCHHLDHRQHRSPKKTVSALYSHTILSTVFIVCRSSKINVSCPFKKFLRTPLNVNHSQNLLKMISYI